VKRAGRCLFVAATLVATSLSLVVLDADQALATHLSCRNGIECTTAISDAPLTASPSSVNLGPAPLVDPAICFVSGGVPSSGCVTAAVTITNTSAAAISVDSASACEHLFSFDEGTSCSTERRSWGGFVGEGPLSTCLPPAFLLERLGPGESCKVTLVAGPNRKGGIHGYFVLRRDRVFVLIVPVFVRGTTSP
jgi:hypothetical protein